MTGFTRSLVSSALAAVVVMTAGALPALARSGTTTTGNDISWPQCGGSYPTGQAFGIVGINHGLANNQNQCLALELVWASGSSGSTQLPKVALYVNTADPGLAAVADWPTSNIDPTTNLDVSATTVWPYATKCNGDNSTACAWQYGWNRATKDMVWLRAAAGSPVNDVSKYRWWLDVETGNTWEPAPYLANNVADLQGMVAAFGYAGILGFGSAGASVGIYSTSYQWSVITGGSTAVTFPGLKGLPDWIPGARTLSAAQANCSLTGFTTTAKPTITQWFGKPYDGDVACP
jgi:hypothetical protein